MFKRFDQKFGRIDIVVANAGLQNDAPSADMTLQAWDQVLGVYLTGQFLCAREGIRSFLAQPAPPVSKAAGKIICMSSVHELIPWAGHVNYAASKGGAVDDDEPRARKSRTARFGSTRLRQARSRPVSTGKPGRPRRRARNCSS